MQIIIVQGMACLGKSTLCRQLEKDLQNCKHFSLDEYKEYIWDKLGFDSVKQRELQTTQAIELFYNDIEKGINEELYGTYLLDYAFTNKYWKELLKHLNKWNIQTKTIYLKPINLKEHEKVWANRSRDFSVRHPGHGATHYHDGTGSDYVNNYETKIFESMATIGDVLEIKISFNPYSMSILYEDIVNFIRE